MNFDDTLFRASSFGYLMTEPKLKKDKEAGNLSETSKTHLIDVYVSKKYDRQTDIHNKYVQKGLMVEEDAITLYSRVKKQFYKKNEAHLKNEFIMGTPDLYEGKSIEDATLIIDIKSSFDIFTFFRNHTKDVSDLYYYQLQCYMWLTGAQKSILAFCLVDTPEVILNGEKRKLLWQMGVATEDNPDFIEACAELDKLLTYPDIKMQERVIEYEILRNDEDIEIMKEKVNKARAYLNELESKINPHVLIAHYDQETKSIIIQ